MMHAIDDLPPRGSRVIALSKGPVIEDPPAYPPNMMAIEAQAASQAQT